MDNPFGIFDSIRESYLRYLDSPFRLRYQALLDERRALLDRDAQLYREPLFEPIAPYRLSGRNVIEAGTELGASADAGSFLANSLFKPDSAGTHRQLYQHQLDAWRASRGGRSVVVTSGTGSGKTECYLLPIFAALAEESGTEWTTAPRQSPPGFWWNQHAGARRSQREHEQGVRPAAMRALLLYPLNALIEDQLGRIRESCDGPAAREWLATHRPDHRFWFGRYNSSTPVPGAPDDQSRLTKLRGRLRKMEREWERAVQSAAVRGPQILPFFQEPAGAEMWSRWDMQDAPPDILITNYSMLNIMLMRDVEHSIFEHTEQWLRQSREHVFHLVVDELHSYRGTPGTEVGYLLRAFLDRIGLHPDSEQLRIIATSASIENDQHSRSYLEQFFGRRGDSFEIISGERTTFDAGNTPLNTHRNAFAAFKSDLDQAHSEVATAVSTLAASLNINPAQAEPARQLDEILTAISAYEPVRLAASQRPVTRDEFASELFPGSDGAGSDAVEGLIRAVILARNAGRIAPLPLRTHFFFHNAGRLWACVNPQCNDSACAGRAALQAAGEEPPPLGRLYTQPVPRCVACGSRVAEMLYCQPCGEVFLGGFTKEIEGEANKLYLTPDYPHLDRIPDRAGSLTRTAGDYAIFWPARSKPLFRTNRGGNRWIWTQDQVDGFQWMPAELNHAEGSVRWPARSPADGKTNGYLFQSPVETANAFASKCPHCGEDWGRLRTASPIRDMGSGFQRVVQLLCDGLVREMERSAARKLVLFSDSRQDAAKLSTGIKNAHYLDAIRQIAFRTMTEQDTSAQEEFHRAQETFTRASELLAIQRKMATATPLTPEETQRMPALMGSLPSSVVGAVGQFAFVGGQPPACLTPPAPLGGHTVLAFDPLCDAVRTRLLHIGMNPGGPQASLARLKPRQHPEIRWEDIFDWNATPRDYKPFNLLDPSERDLKSKIEASLMTEVVESVLFAAGSRDFEALRLGFLWIRPHPPTNAHEEAAAATIRILLGKNKRWDGSDREGQLEPPGSVKRFIEEAAQILGEDRQQLTSRVEGILGSVCNQWLINPRRLFVLRPRPDAQSTIPVYPCPRCGRTHLHRSVGVCTRCTGRLEAAPHAEAVTGEAGDYYEFLARCEAPEFRLNCSELTGQTDSDERRNRQRLFQEVVMQEENEFSSGVDLLSVTTTMEAGVDIGSLQALGMANMPPVRFNYQQRVGRAGRRGLGLSIAMTLCRGRSHDEYYFERPHLITAEPPPPPYVDVTREEVARRVVSKEVLRRAFRGLPHGDSDEEETPMGGDVHGEFGTIQQWQTTNKAHVEQWIQAHRTDIEHICEVVLKRTAMDNAAGRQRMADWITGSLVPAIDQAIASEGSSSETLSKRSASYGVLPMFGFPTKVRLLYHRKPAVHERRGTIDRDLDIAISQFAPGAQTVKDDLLHTAVGVVEYFPQGNRMAEVPDPLRNPIAVGICRRCQGLVTVNPVPGPCPYCSAAPDEKEGYSVAQVNQPPAFCTPEVVSRWWEAEFDGNFEFTPRAMRARISAQQVAPVTRRNFVVDRMAQCRVYKINDNAGEGFRFMKWRGHEIYYTEEGIEQALRQLKAEQRLRVLDTRPVPDETAGELVRSLASISTTDVLTAGIAEVPVGLCLNPAVDEAKAAWYSFGFMIRRAAAVRLDVAESEIEMGIQPFKDYSVPFEPPSARIFLSDTLENGAGYSALLGEPNEFEALLFLILGTHPTKGGQFHDPLIAPQHQSECATSCHRCLREFGNMPYHTILDWRVGLDMARLALDSAAPIDFQQSYWIDLLHQQAPAYFQAFDLDLEDENGVDGVYVGIDNTRGDAVIITHPLWDTNPANYGAELASAVSRMEGRGLVPHCVSIFRALRFPFELPV